MNWQQVRTNWSKVREQFHTKWEKLSEADLSAIAGRRDELVRRLRDRYAMKRHAAEEEAEDFVRELH